MSFLSTDKTNLCKRLNVLYRGKLQNKMYNVVCTPTVIVPDGNAALTNVPPTIYNCKILSAR